MLCIDGKGLQKAFQGTCYRWAANVYPGWHRLKVLFKAWAVNLIAVVVFSPTEKKEMQDYPNILNQAICP